MLYDIHIGGKSHRLTLNRDLNGWKCSLDGKDFNIDARLVRPSVLSLLIEGKAYEIERDAINGQTRLWVERTPYIAEVRDPRALGSRSLSAKEHGAAKLLASMPGKVLRVLVAATDQVEIGQALVVVEAMKMQNEIKSPIKGTVSRVVSQSTQVNAGDVLAIVEPSPLT